MIEQRALTTIFSGLLALGVLAALPVRAAEGEFMRDAMSSIGLIEPERPAITYRERAPLVMPPNLSGKGTGKAAARKHGKGKDAATSPEAETAMPLSLPPPQIRQVDPQWPKDPEVTRRERARADENKPVVRGAQGRMNDNNETLSAAEMEGGRRAGAGLSNQPAPLPGEARDRSWFDPLALFGGRKADAEPAAIEPDRDGLTDPPTGYRKAPAKLEKAQGGPVGNSISGNEEADPRAFMRSQAGH